MAKNNNLTDFLTGIANAIRTKKGTTAPINPQDFEDEISGISTSKPEQEKSVTPKTTVQEVIPDSGKVLSKVTVGAIQTEEKTVELTASGQTEITPTSGKYLSKVTTSPKLQNMTVTPKGASYTVNAGSGYAGLGTVTVAPAIEDVSTADGMGARLVSANVGKVYRYTGTTDSTYTNGDLYEVVSE